MTKAPKHSRRTETGIELTRDVMLKAEWPNFVANMIKVAVNGFAAAYGAVDKAAEAGANLLEAAGAIKVDSPPGARGWSLFCLGFAWAFDELRALDQVDGADIEAAVREALDKARVLVDQGNQVMPVSFLDHPTTLPLYKIVRDTFIARKGAFRPAGGEADEVLRARFDAAFDRAVFLLWSQAPEKYQPLAAALSVPAAKAHASHLEWDAYRKHLIHSFEVKPVFGQEESKISLSQLYVPLRGVWREEANEKPSAATAKTPPRIGHLVQLDAELNAWSTGGEEEYELKLLGGGPGSGKSTTVKALASRLASRADCRPLFIPLLHINPAKDLRDEINRYFTQGTDNPFRQAPLARSAVESGPPLVLIFDGLDEQAVAGRGSDELVRDFMISLTQLASSLRGERRGRLRAIVTGRMPSFQAAQRYASNVRRAYEVLGFLPLTNPVVQKLFANVRSEEHQELAKLDQRVIWWERYTTAVSGENSNPPKSLTDTNLAEITHEPLLCYLLVLSGYATDDVQVVASNRNVIYGKLVDEVWRRGWGDGQGSQRRPGPGRFLDQDGFNSLMETIALAGWQGGDTRICTEQGFLSATKALRTGQAWEQFVQDSGADITNLAINFYFKRSDIDMRGFEFTHKSFGDYLAARALIRVAFDVGSFAERRAEAALKEWFDITAAGRLSHELLDYIERELRLLADNSLEREKVCTLKRMFEGLASTVLRNGLPANGNAEELWRAAEEKQRNAEIMIWAVLAGCTNALAKSGSRESSSNEDRLINVDWPDETALGDLLRRLSRQVDLSAFCNSIAPAMSWWNMLRGWLVGWTLPELSDWTTLSQFPRSRQIGGFVGALRRSRVATVTAPIMRCFAFLNAKGADLSGQVICGIDLRNADLREAHLDYATLLYCDLRDAKLEKATFRNANLDATLFQRADLSGSIWQQAKLRQTAFSDAILDGALFDSAVALEGDITIAALKKSGATVERLGVVRDDAGPEIGGAGAKSQGAGFL